MASGEVATAARNIFQIDEDYEFSAPQFFDFSTDETEEDIRKAELWFDSGKSDAPSPYMMRIKASRFENVDGVLCDFDDAKENAATERQESNPELRDSRLPSQETEQKLDVTICADGEIPPSEMNDPVKEEPNEVRCLEEKLSSLRKQKAELIGSSHEASNSKHGNTSCKSSFKGEMISTSVSSKLKKEIAKKEPPFMKPKKAFLQPGKGLSKLQVSSSRVPTTAGGEVAQDNQAIKRQRLDNGSMRQIHSVKSRILHHKSKPDLMKGMDSASASGYLHEEIGPYISVAEMIKKFESKTRELDLKHPHEDTPSAIQKRQRLVLTRPKEPELQTAHRVRAIRIKSSADLEAEMLARIPKFKARPVNKKILEAPSLPPLPKRTPQAPEFREFNLKTMERFEKASGGAQAPPPSSTTDSICQDQSKVLKLTEARPPLLETALRARPSRMKTTEEEELEALEKAPKFKAIPLNKKILESKGDIGLPCKPKSQVTVPQEFNFATTERFGPSQLKDNVVDLFDKLSIHSSEHNEHNATRITVPNPFNLQTEERGIEKEKRFTEQLIQKQMVEEKSRVPKANPYPYTTDYPVIPPKPQPKEITRPEVFQLESLIRHDEEQQRKLEMMERMEREETQRRIFRAQPIMKEDPLPLPEKKTKPLTEVQEVVLHVKNRAEDRSEFDKKIKEKELMLKRMRDDFEQAKKIEEEKALKQMRRTMVPQARPIPDFSNPFLPQKSIKEKTKAKSPKLIASQREARRRHYIR